MKLSTIDGIIINVMSFMDYATVSYSLDYISLEELLKVTNSHALSKFNLPNKLTKSTRFTLDGNGK